MHAGKKENVMEKGTNNIGMDLGTFTTSVSPSKHLLRKKARPLKITHVNHASLLIEADGEFILTDPWYLSPAFGGWTQNLSPSVETIRTILSIPPDKLRVVISHGHDDHLDEFFIASHLGRCQIYVPQFKTNGLSKRIERLTGIYPTELSAKPLSVGGFSLAAYINEDFTNYDALILVGSKNHGLIHANDNWHRYPVQLIDQLKAFIAKFQRENVFFLTQFGIADCFPLNYPDYSPEEALEIVRKRYVSYGEAISSNIERLGLPCAYCYANQSTYRSPAPYAGISLYELAQQYISSSGLPIRQLTPNAELNSNGILRPAETYGDLFTFCLKFLERAVQERIGPDWRLKFLLPDETPDAEDVAYQADRVTWQRILIGELTLESIIIGGMGLVFKPKARNIAEVHHKVSKVAYLIQSGIKKYGISFYFREPSNINFG